MEKRLKSEQVVVAAPFSFHGSAARIWKITRNENLLLRILLIGLALGLIFFAWTVIFFWYIIFSFLLVPYRLVRRGQRKRKMENLRHRELLEAIQDKKTTD